MLWCSVDPGKNGAIVQWEDLAPVSLLEVTVPQGQRFFGPTEVANFHDMFQYCDVVVIEAFLDNRMSAQSTVHANTTAANFGIQIGCALYRDIEVEIVRAADWKRRMAVAGKTVDKYAALEMARELFPDQADWLKRKKDLDTAEALLIGQDFIDRSGING